MSKKLPSQLEQALKAKQIETAFKVAKDAMMALGRANQMCNDARNKLESAGPDAQKKMTDTICDHMSREYAIGNIKTANFVATIRNTVEAVVGSKQEVDLRRLPEIFHKNMDLTHTSRKSTSNSPQTTEATSLVDKNKVQGKNNEGR